MNFLQGVQALHREAKLSGAAPDAVTGQTGRAADLVAWYAQAWNDIQLDRDGKWRWLRTAFVLTTVADLGAYLHSHANMIDGAAGGAITRFRAWDIDSREPPTIYLQSGGTTTIRNLQIEPWTSYRETYFNPNTAAAPPSVVSVDNGGIAGATTPLLWLGPKPDDVYVVGGSYWRSNQTLVDDDDEPEMPSDYHMAIVYRALVKYGFNAVGREVLSRVNAELPPIYNSLVENQAYSRLSMVAAGPLA